MTRRAKILIRGRMSATELETLDTLAGKGWIAGRIALQMNRHPSTIHYVMLRRGHKTLRYDQKRHACAIRNGKPVVSFSRAEDRLIIALRQQQLAPAAIADQAAETFGYRRSPHTIGVRLMMLATLDDEQILEAAE